MAEKKKAPARTCNLCGLEKKDARGRLQYPAFACNKCYQRWKRGLLP